LNNPIWTNPNGINVTDLSTENVETIFSATERESMQISHNQLTIIGVSRSRCVYLRLVAD